MQTCPSKSETSEFSAFGTIFVGVWIVSDQRTFSRWPLQVIKVGLLPDYLAGIGLCSIKHSSSS